MEKEEVRKGPWIEQEDVQLVFYVNLFGDRRWDFVAKVSGLKRTGKSCRLRWVNYLHPDLKRGKMTPNEERLVVELQSKWGNRLGDSASAPAPGIEGERSFYDTGGVELPTLGEKNKTGDLEVEVGNKVYSMDDLWKEFEFSEENCPLTSQTVASPIWDYCPTDSLWCMSEEESKMLMMQQQPPVGDHHFQPFPFYNYMIG
ncbi:hypothetical protein SASPL_101080 [Salvia splendens]|uniref:Myb proto-oncogene protein, plant n=1 Tax=Salvia splendens TaxID=180675 RepID=A0A8X8YR36_SALSN|nr:hypothetical protein SASPL_101080 [Salvia splendens]